ncbi:MAG: thermonuclease family protein [Oscillatoria sp. SIO1A7]|nr:thermonuclease family protein [Oscillatoria sp. SIO1A7]
MNELKSTVAKIADGDSFYVDDKTSVRLLGIDAPELEQKGGRESKARLSELLPIGSEVSLLYQHRDRYNRILAIVFRADVNVNLQMILEGQAIIYWQYINDWIGDRRILFKAEKAAQRQKRGVWDMKDFIEPKIFRQSKHKT